MGTIGGAAGGIVPFYFQIGLRILLTIILGIIIRFNFPICIIIIFIIKISLLVLQTLVNLVNVTTILSLFKTELPLKFLVSIQILLRIAAIVTIIHIIIIL